MLYISSAHPFVHPYAGNSLLCHTLADIIAYIHDQAGGKSGNHTTRRTAPAPAAGEIITKESAKPAFNYLYMYLLHGN